ncbi:hypothetical protein BBJ28_00019159 [Nothophytophthora sp. Chile5]|nr:hypothetical protein BBJ28_00019159 [Nothophytophthora sp. Chile5]
MSCALNHPAADMTLVDLESGEEIRLLELVERSAKPTILLFYATWSKACAAEVEMMEAWSKDGHHKLANFVLVSLDQNIGEALAFLDQVNPTTKLPRVCRDYCHGETPTVRHFGCNEVPEPYGVQRVPHKVVVDKDGIVRRNNDDFHWDDVAGLLRHLHEERAKVEENITTFLFPSIAT